MDVNYNSNSVAQLDSFIKNKEWFSKCVELMVENHLKNYGNKSIKILDIGCSHGGNSIVQINTILDIIYSKISENQLPTIEIYHEDLEINDFSKLFIEISQNKSSYLLKKRGNNNIFSYAIGKGFQNQLMKSSSVDFIFSYFTLMWASETNVKFHYNPNSIIINKESSRPDGYREHFKNQFESVYTHRLNELKKGGVFVCNFLIINNQTVKVHLEDSCGNFKNIFFEMVKEGILSKQEVENMILPFAYLNEKEHFEISNKLSLKGLKLLHSDSQIYDWNENSGGNSIKGVESLLSVFSPFIKKEIFGDSYKKEMIYSEFLKRVYSLASKDSNAFNFSYTLLFNYFQKQ